MSSMVRALRSLAKYPTSTLVICLSLALAVAGNVIAFGILEALVLRPLPYPGYERLMLLWQTNRQEGEGETPVTPADFTDWRERTRSFAAIEAYRDASFNLTGGDQPEEVRAMSTTPGGLSLLGAAPRIGRTFLPEEGKPGQDRVAVLSQDLWQRRFGGDPAVVGQTIQLDDRPYTVVGVLPEDWDFLVTEIDLWVPLALAPSDLPRDRHDLYAMARLAPGITPAAAKAEMTALGGQLEAEHPDTNRGYGAAAQTMRETFPGPTDRHLYAFIQGTMVFLLLIACANIANVLLARGQERQQEMALRTTLGAKRGRLVGQLLVESLLLALLGGGLGIAFGAVGLDLLDRGVASQLPRSQLLALNGEVLGFTLAIIAFAALLFGLAPALAATRPDLASALKEGGRGGGPGRRRRLVSRLLVVGEVTLALVMLSGTGLLVRAIVELQSLDPGFPVANRLTCRLALPDSRYPDDAAVSRFYEEVLGRLAALPGVESATATTSLPRSRGNPTATFQIDGREDPDFNPPPVVTLAVPHGYFAAMGIPLRSGRAFTPADRAGDPPVAVISNAMAERYFPKEDPLGRRLRIEGASREIVGIAADVVQGRLLDREGRAAIVYLPHAQKPERALFMVLRTAGEMPAGLPDEVRRTVWALDAALPLSRMMSLTEHISQQFVGARLLGAVMGAFGLVALLLAAVGIYGVVSYSVSQRTREIGLRMAVGARRFQVMRQITRQGLLMALVGIAIGIPGALGVSRLVEAMLGGMAPLSPAVLPAVGLVLVLVAGAASFFPARRAAALDPVTALRAE
jgi:putative ABC transport system permease protein